MSSKRTRNLIYLLEEMLEKEIELEAGINAWSTDSDAPDYDPCHMASCDPSDQYILSEEIDELWEQVVGMIKITLDKGLYSPYNSTHRKQILGAINMKSKAFTYVCIAVVVMCVVGLVAQIQF